MNLRKYTWEDGLNLVKQILRLAFIISSIVYLLSIPLIFGFKEDLAPLLYITIYVLIFLHFPATGIIVAIIMYEKFIRKKPLLVFKKEIKLLIVSLISLVILIAVAYIVRF